MATTTDRSYNYLNNRGIINVISYHKFMPISICLYIGAHMDQKHGNDLADVEQDREGNATEEICNYNTSIKILTNDIKEKTNFFPHCSVLLQSAIKRIFSW